MLTASPRTIELTQVGNVQSPNKVIIPNIGNNIGIHSIGYLHGYSLHRIKNQVTKNASILHRVNTSAQVLKSQRSNIKSHCHLQEYDQGLPERAPNSSNETPRLLLCLRHVQLPKIAGPNL